MTKPVKKTMVPRRIRPAVFDHRGVWIDLIKKDVLPMRDWSHLRFDAQLPGAKEPIGTTPVKPVYREDWEILKSQCQIVKAQLRFNPLTCEITLRIGVAVYRVYVEPGFTQGQLIESIRNDLMRTVDTVPCLRSGM